MSKIMLAAQGAEHGPGRDPRTDHLRPVIDFLLAQGNRPAGWRGDAFWGDQGGEEHYNFTDPIDAAQLRERFAFPDSIRLYDDGTIQDGLNRVDINPGRPPRRFSFEALPLTAAPNQSPQATPEPPAADEGTADEQLRQIVERMRQEPDR